MGFNYAVCSEIFEGVGLRDLCETIRPMGYTGIEIAPFTMAPSVDDVSPARRRELRLILEGEGIVCVGLHWLLVSPKDLHLTVGAPEGRKRSWNYLASLIGFCADLGGRRMTLGSPQQRSAREGISPGEARDRIAEGLADLVPRLREREVTLLIEPVSSKETNVIVSLAEAAAIVDAVGDPSVRTMFDVHNAADETDDIAALLEKYYDVIDHVHVNEIDGHRPGTGRSDFAGVLAALKRRRYDGWISLEVFDFSEGPEAIARESIAYLRNLELVE